MVLTYLLFLQNNSIKVSENLLTAARVCLGYSTKLLQAPQWEQNSLQCSLFGRRKISGVL